MIDSMDAGKALYPVRCDDLEHKSLFYMILCATVCGIALIRALRVVARVR
jgi:hypothetical protein